MANVKVKLVKPITTHQGDVSEIEMREPSFRDYVELGEPFMVGRADDGAPFVVENAEAISAYLRRCVVGVDPTLLNQTNARSARRLKNALLGFFDDAGPATEGQTTSPTTSSS